MFERIEKLAEDRVLEYFRRGLGTTARAQQKKIFIHLDDASTGSASGSWGMRAPASYHAMRPTSLVSLKYRCSIGRRMSQSINSTRLPWQANDDATLLLIIVLPSPGIVLVIRMDLGKSSFDWILIEL